MKYNVILIATLMFSLNVMAKKHALIIAIGDYPARTGWSSISSVNDISLIKKTLLNQGFDNENINILKNEEATRLGILKAIESLKTKLKSGDIVVIHYSGHGQQIFDNNGDEIDDKDEAIVPYDALVRYTSNYKGENHIRDDELGNIISGLRNILGENGQLLILLDSCHSGSATRGGKARGGKATFAPPNWTPSQDKDDKGSGLLEVTKLKADAAPFVMLSGASANELNYEYKGYGSLSFAFSKAMADLGSDITYRKLFSSISSTMNVITPNQNPTIEGDIDYKLFKGDYVKQQSYYEILKVSRLDVVRINAGKLHGLFNGTTINILPSGSSKVETDAIIAKGKIIKADFNESIIELDTPLNSQNKKDFWVFVDEPAYGDMKISIYLDKSLKSKKTKDNIANFLSEQNLGIVVKDSLDADLIILESKNTISLNTVNGKANIYKQTKIDGDYNFNSITSSIFSFAQGTYLKNLNLKNNDYEFEFFLLPVKYNEITGETILLEDTILMDDSGKFKVKAETDEVVPVVINKSDKTIYFSIVEINSKGEISSFLPNNNYNLNSNERMLAPGKKMIFKNCIYEFSEPFETLVLKGFASSRAINLKPTIESKGEISTRGKNRNPLENFIGETYPQTRGSKSRTNTDSIDGYSTEFIYEIVKER